VLPALVLAWTVWGISDYRKLKLALARGDREALIREYKVTIAGEVVGGALALAAVGWSILGADPDVDLAITGIFRSPMYGGIAGLALGVLASP